MDIALRLAAQNPDKKLFKENVKLSMKAHYNFVNSLKKALNVSAKVVDAMSASDRREVYANTVSDSIRNLCKKH